MTELKCPIHNTPLEKDFGYDGDYSCSKCGSNIMFGSEELWQALIDTKKKLDRYEKALEKIAKDRKIISMTGYDFDNEIYVNAAREALGLPFDILEYDNV